jgi:hypothetical protein
VRIGRLAAPVSHCVYIRYETLLRHSLHGELEHRLVVCTAGVDLRGPYFGCDGICACLGRHHAEVLGIPLLDG